MIYDSGSRATMNRTSFFLHVYPSQLTAPLSDSNRPIGLLAGWGNYPRAIAEQLRAQGIRLLASASSIMPIPDLADLCEHFDWIGLGGIGRAIRLFKRWGVREAIMAGKVHKVLLYQPGWWLKHRPDWTCIKAFSPQLIWGKSDRKDDTLLSTIVSAFARQGIDFQPITKFAPELLVSSGRLAGKPLTSKQQKDVSFGWQTAKVDGRTRYRPNRLHQESNRHRRRGDRRHRSLHPPSRVNSVARAASRS